MTRRSIARAWIVACAGLLLGASVAPAQTPPAAEPPAPPADVASLFPRELVEWKAFEGNPVFANGGPNAWDARIRERGWILKEGDRWTLWYTGYDATKTGLRMLGRATSDDGIRWVREPNEPLDRQRWIEDVQVVKRDRVYLMFAEGVNDVAHQLTSEDGIRWTERGPLDIRLASGEPIPAGARGTPTLWSEKGVDYLFYERSDKGVWLATSKDGKVWTNVQDEPVLPMGPSDYDKYAVAMNQVIKYRGRYYGFYHASDTPEWKEWSTCVAASDDLVRWTKYPQNPLLRENKSSGIVVHDGRRWRMYTMHNQVQLHFSAVAESPAE